MYIDTVIARHSRYDYDIARARGLQSCCKNYCVSDIKHEMFRTCIILVCMEETNR